MAARWPVLAAAAVAAASAPWLQGCAGPRPVSREAYVREQMAALVLPRSVDAVWPLLRELLSEQGYNGIDDPGTLLYESEWKLEAPPSRFAGKLVRYHARGIRLPESRSRVVLTRYVRNLDLGRGPPELSEGTRDFEMELLLYKKVDPDEAALLERRAGSSDPSSRR